MNYFKKNKDSVKAIPTSQANQGPQAGQKKWPTEGKQIKFPYLYNNAHEDALFENLRRLRESHY